MSISDVLPGWSVLLKGFMYFCLLNLVGVDSYRISVLSDQASRDLNEKWIHWEIKAKPRDNANTNKRREESTQSVYERKFVPRLIGHEENENRQLSHSRKTSLKKSSDPLTTSGEKFSARLRRTGGQEHTKGRKEFVSFRNLVEKDGLNSYAVADPPEKSANGSKWNVTTVSAILVLVIILALCLHAPCPYLWRRHRSERDVIKCPNPSAHNGMCGKCVFHSDSSTVRMRYEEKASHGNVSMTGNHGCYPSASKRLSSEYLRAQETHPASNLNRAKKKVSAMFKGTVCGQRYESQSAYRYKPLRNVDKREKLHTTYEPEWTSIGAFLNTNPKSSSSSRGYGSTNQSEGKFVERYGRRSRDSLELCPDVVEYSLKLRPKKRQVIELQEFPLGYSKTYLNIDLESDPGVVYDPCREQLHGKRSWASERLTQSDSDLRELSCSDRPGSYDKESLFDAGKPKKSSLKLRFKKSKSNSKVVHFFPSNFDYDAQFVQMPSKNEKIKIEENVCENKLSVSDPKGCTKSSYNVGEVEAQVPSRDFIKKDSKGLPELPTKLPVIETGNKEHAIDWDLTSPSMETTPLAEPVKGSSYSTGTIFRSKEKLISSEETSAFERNMGTKSAVSKSVESLSSSFTDFCISSKLDYKHSSSYTDLRDSELDYKPEPLAGLLSPKRNRQVRAHDVEGSAAEKAIYTAQRDDIATLKSSQSESLLEEGDLCAYRKHSDIPSHFAHDQYYPVKDSSTVKRGENPFSQY